jgi:hypothetical protein
LLFDDGWTLLVEFVREASDARGFGSRIVRGVKKEEEEEEEEDSRERRRGTMESWSDEGIICYLERMLAWLTR